MPVLFEKAIQSQDPEIVQLIFNIPGIDLNCEDSKKIEKLYYFNNSPIFYAIDVNAPQIVQMFLNNESVDLNHENENILYKIFFKMEF